MVGTVTGAFTVRPYAAADRDAVRHICHVTGYMGEPAWMWRDQESFADLWSSYYTDREPGSASVAVASDGRVVGYLLGCRDTAAAGPALGPVRRHLLGRGLLFRPGTAGVLWRAGWDLLVDRVKGRATPDELIDARWPAHLHIDLLPEARGSGVGRRLMTGWLECLRADGIAGCHLGTWAENADAIAFFETMGFRRHGAPTRMAGMRSREGARHHGQWMVQDLTGPRS
ncbi:GNAT family N-acetyltransferase [soil metagenome]